MFELSIRFQLASICFLAVVVYSFISSKSMSLRSTKCFSAMIIGNLLNLFFDIFSVYAVTYYRELPEWLTWGAHMLFYISLEVSCYFFYVYFSNLARDGRPPRKWLEVLKMLPLIFAVGLNLVGEIHYVSEPDAVFSSGTATMGVYIALAFYLTLAMVDTIYGKLRREDRYVAGVSIGIWIVIGIIQMGHPQWLLSGLGLTLMTTMTYLSFENPKAHMDKDVGVFNSYALRMVLKEKLYKPKKDFYLLTLVITEFDMWEQRLGHKQACEILTRVSRFMEVAVGEDQAVFRTGNNQLTIVLDKDRDAVAKIADRITNQLYNYMQIGQHKVRANGKIHILQCPTYCKTIGEISDLMKFAGDRCKECEEIITFVDQNVIDNMNRIAKVEEIVQNAIDNDGFNVVYQPIYSAEEQKFVSAEALVRLKDTATLGFISPEEFIPIAERSGQINQFGDLIFKKVCRFAREHDLINKGIHYLEINLSGIQMMDQRLPKRLSQILNVFNIQPDFMNLEITETAAVESGETLLSNVLSLKKIGCSFSMDDFGTGYSNLAQMATIPYELVKVDKSLIWPCFPKEEDKDKAGVKETAEKAKNILEGIISILHKMGIRIVAEGVETEAMANYLMELGVEYLQGYYYSRPIGEEEYLQFIAEH